MTLEEAKEKMADLMKEEMDYYYKYINPSSNEKPISLDTFASVEFQEKLVENTKNQPTEEQRRKYKSLGNKVHRFGEELATYPELFEVMEQFN